MTSVMSRMRPDETTRPRSGTSGTPGGIALLPIGADLLPRQTVTGRGGRRTRVVAAGIVAAAVLGVVAGDVLSHAGRSTAEDRLQTAQDQQRSLQHQLAQYDDLVAVQAQATTLRDTVARLMATDTPWSVAIAEAVDAQGRVDINDVSIAGVDPTATTSATATTTPGAVGSVTLQGTAPDKTAIAAFADAVGKLKGFASPFVSSASQTDGKGFTFTMTVDLTSGLRSVVPPRWTTTTTGGGK